MLGYEKNTKASMVGMVLARKVEAGWIRPCRALRTVDLTLGGKARTLEASGIMSSIFGD